MNQIQLITAPLSLPALVRNAAAKLARAETSAEVLDARREASFAYDAAKLQGRIAKAKQAHDEIIVAVMHAQADALDIESAAKRRLADEYDAAQEAGQIRTNGGSGYSVLEKPTVADIGLTGKDIHEARQIRNAERADPGIIRRTLDGLIERGEEPTRAAVRREIAPTPIKYTVSNKSMWLWGRLCDLEREGTLNEPIAELLDGMTSQMRDDVRRLAPLVREFLEELEVSLDYA